MKINDEVQSDYFVLTDKGCFLRSLTEKEAAKLKASGTPIKEAEHDGLGAMGVITRPVIASLFNQAHQMSLRLFRKK